MDVTRRRWLAVALAAPAAEWHGSSNYAAAAERPRTPEQSAGELHERRDRDLRLPPWGPFTKKYYGISHVPLQRTGLRFDLGVSTGLYRRTPMVPNVLWESGHHPWEAASDLSYYSARFDIEWKDQVYGDVSFTAVDDDARLLTLDLFNRTAVEQNLSVHLLSSMNFPAGAYQASVPQGGIWVHALDYEKLEFAAPRPTDNLEVDALMRGEARDPLCVGGSGIGRERLPFAADAGDTINYSIQVEKPLREAVLLLRYRTFDKGGNAFDFDGAVRGRLNLPGSAEFTLAELAIGELPAGRHSLRLRSEGGAAIGFDGFALVERERKRELKFEPLRYDPNPKLLPGPTDTSLILKYGAAPVHYGLAWVSPDFPLKRAEGREVIIQAGGPGEFVHFRVREFFTDDLDCALRFYTHNHFGSVLRSRGDGHFTDVFVSPIMVAPNSTQRLQALVCAGGKNAVEEKLSAFRPGDQWEALRDAARKRRWSPPANPAGEKYTFSQERMGATVLTNLVYPVYFRRGYMKHNSPGRFWDSLYTWDSGFVALGLSELDLDRSLDCLNQYVTEPGDPAAAYVQHGTPCPTQIFAFQEIWNRTQSRPVLEYFYPRLRQMHMFLAGRLGSSTCRRWKSQMIATWDYFYNTGWDDYPAQTFLHLNHLESSVCTAAMTSYLIRTAKILRLAAAMLGDNADVALYQSDIDVWKTALQEHSWDDASGYFGYVTHDGNGNPSGILRDATGGNFNMGMDGVLPLFAGICTRAQQERLCAHLMSERNLWTPIGLTTVDQSAPYFRNDGYWNGAVWMPHQWMIWRALLDMGRAAEARRIAFTALDLWKREVDLSYNCFEHFLVKSGRGAGWHQFSGLSSPVLAWFSAYYRPGRLSTGLDVWVKNLEVAPDHTHMRAQLHMLPSEAPLATIIACLQQGASYQAKINGNPVATDNPVAGAWELSVPRTGETEYTLEILPRR